MPRRAASSSRPGRPTPAGGCRSAPLALRSACAANRKGVARRGAGRQGVVGGGGGGALRATEPQVARQRRRCAAAPSAAHRRRRLVAGRWPSPGERPHAGVGSSPRRREGNRRRPRVPSLLAPASPQQPHAPAARCQSEPVQPTCWNYQMKPVTGGMDNQNRMNDRSPSISRFCAEQTLFKCISPPKIFSQSSYAMERLPGRSKVLTAGAPPARVGLDVSCPKCARDVHSRPIMA